MRQSFLYAKTIKEAPKDEKSFNAELLYRAGYTDKLMAGVYSYLPLGLKVLENIKNIIREEMNGIGGQEILMPALHPKKVWDETGRWEEGKDIMFQFKGRGDSDLGLGWTHEEIITSIMRGRSLSYKDLPILLYQIQDKFRNEPRAKSGLLRGREFSMKDLYSFHTNEENLSKFYEQSKEVYQRVFARCGLDSIVTEASGGAFTKEFSHEFQVLTKSGEDIIYYCQSCDFAQNKEVYQGKDKSPCPNCDQPIVSGKSIEVGNIFKLFTRFSEPMKLMFNDEDGKRKPVVMGSYGIGPSRVMGAIVEVHHDDAGIIWPAEVSPFDVHFIIIDKKNELAKEAEDVYNMLQESGISVLLDDRDESAGVKFAESDLIGIPRRLILSPKTHKNTSLELVDRKTKKSTEIKFDKLIQVLKSDDI